MIPWFSVGGDAVTVKEGVEINHRVVIAMDALTASQRKALEPVLRDRQGFLAEASRQTTAVKGPSGNLLYRRDAGHGFQLEYSIVDGSVVIHDVMREVPPPASAAKKSKASPGAKTARAQAVRKG